MGKRWKIFCAIMLGYPVCASILEFTYHVKTESTTVVMFTIVITAMLLLYGLLLRSPVERLSWKKAIPLVLLCQVGSPSVLQTDQLRYMRDGIAVVTGENPYLVAPETDSRHTSFAWRTSINHPEYRTIYPPLAQITFGLSTVLNPWLWHEAWGISFAPRPVYQWQLEFGWQLMAGLLSVLLLYILRRRRFELLLAHPLYVAMALGNAHVDILMVVCLAATFATAYWRHWWIRTGAFAAAILAKWLPLMFAPLLLLAEWRRHGWQKAALRAGVVVALVLAASLPFVLTSQGGFTESLAIYLRKWYFFGYLHRFIADVLLVVGDKYHAYNHARYISLVVFCVWAPFVFYAYCRGKWSLRLSAFLLMLGFNICNPTLHPWYLVLMLTLGMPFFRVLLVSWVWPALALYCVVYYYDWKDPKLVRYTVYSIVTVVLYFDAKRLWRHWALTVQS